MKPLYLMAILIILVLVVIAAYFIKGIGSVVVPDLRTETQKVLDNALGWFNERTGLENYS